MTEPKPRPEGFSLKSPLVSFGGTPESGQAGRPIYLSDPDKYTLDGQPLPQFTLYDAGARQETGLQSARVRMLVTKPGKDGRFYQDTAIQTPDPGGEFPWDRIGAVEFVDTQGNKVLIPRNELRLTKPRPKAEATAPLEFAEENADLEGHVIEPEALPGPVPTGPAPAAGVPEETGRNILTLIGLKGIRERARDLAERYMEAATKVKKGWNMKNFLREWHLFRRTEFYKQALEATNNMLADESITRAYDMAQQQHQGELQGMKGLTLYGTKLREWFKDRFGGYSRVDELTLKNLEDMRAGGELAEDRAYSSEEKAMNLRFQQELGGDLGNFIRDGLGEKVTKLDPTNSEHKKIIDGLRDMIVKHHGGDTNYDSEVKFRDRLHDIVGSLDPATKQELFPESELFGSSVWHWAERLKQEADHVDGLATIDRALEQTEFRVGVAAMGERTKLEKTATQGWVERIKKLTNFKGSEYALGTAVSFTIALGRLPGQMLARSVGRVWLGGGAGAAVTGFVAYRKELGKLRNEYTKFLKAQEAGSSPDAKWFEQFGIKLRSTDDLIQSMTNSLYETDGTTVKPQLDENALRSAFAHLADAKARNALADTTESPVALIELGAKGVQEQNRTNLDLTISRVERDLTTYASSNAGSAEVQALMGSANSADFLKNLTEAQVLILKEGVAKLDSLADPVKATLGTVSSFAPEAEILRSKLLWWGKQRVEAHGIDEILNEFEKSAKQEAAKRGITTGTLGLAIGSVISEAGQDLVDWGRTGQFSFHGPIASLFGEQVGGVAATTEFLTGPASHIPGLEPVDGHFFDAKLPEEAQLVLEPDGTHSLFFDGKEVADQLRFDPDTGALTNLAAVQEELKDAGWQVHDALGAPFSFGEGAPVDSGMVDLKDWDERGFWGIFEDKLSGADVDHHNAAINVVKNALRGYQLHFISDVNGDGIPDNVTFTASPHALSFHDTVAATAEGKQEIFYNALPNGAVFHVPASLFSDASIVELGQMADNGANLFEALKLAHPDWTTQQILDEISQTDQALAIATKIGFVGGEANIPSREELEILMRALAPGGGEELTTVTPHITEFIKLESTTPGGGGEPWPIPIIGPPAGTPWGKPPRAKHPYFGSFGYHGYRSDSTFDRETWKKSRSPSLIENPSASINQQAEINRYLESQSPSYLAEVDQLNNQIGAQMKDSVRAVVCMPVAAHVEGDNIYGTLKLYAEQKVDWDKAEIDLFVNWPDSAYGKTVQKTLTEIERFKNEHPEIPVRIFQKEFPKSEIRYGNIVKHLNDVVVRRIQQAGISQDVMLVTNDADLLGISNNYLSSMVALADSKKDGYLGKLEWGSMFYPDYPGFHTSMRFLQYVDSVVRHLDTEQKHVPSSGANFAVKASTFAAVGGYNDQIGAGADTELGRKIVAARLGNRNAFGSEEGFPLVYNNAIWLETDPRRALEYYKSGRSLVNMWDDFDEGGYRPAKIVGDDKESLQTTWPETVKRIEFQISTMIDQWLGFDKPELYQRPLNWLLGNKGWRAEGNQIILTDDGKTFLKEQLTKYREQELYNLKYRVGSGTKKDLGSSTVEPTKSESSPTTVDPDRERSDKFWSRGQPRGLRETMINIIQSSVEDNGGKFAHLAGFITNPDGTVRLDEKSQEEFSAYKILARELGYHMGEPQLHEKSGTLEASMTKIPS